MSYLFLFLTLFCSDIKPELLAPVKLNSQHTFPAKITPQNGVLKGGISLQKDLPKEFYGTWSVASKLIETNNPVLYREKSSDIWIFYRNGNVITLYNPVSKAEASIIVQEVKEKTAIFTRQNNEDNISETETPEITVEGDTFYGTDIFVTDYYKNGYKIKTDIVKYELKGVKITGPTLKQILF